MCLPCCHADVAPFTVDELTRGAGRSSRCVLRRTGRSHLQALPPISGDGQHCGRALPPAHARRVLQRRGRCRLLPQRIDARLLSPASKYQLIDLIAICLRSFVFRGPINRKGNGQTVKNFLSQYNTSALKLRSPPQRGGWRLPANPQKCVEARPGRAFFLGWQPIASTGQYATGHKPHQARMAWPSSAPHCR